MVTGFFKCCGGAGDCTCQQPHWLQQCWRYSLSPVGGIRRAAWQLPLRFGQEVFQRLDHARAFHTPHKSLEEDCSWWKSGETMERLDPLLGGSSQLLSVVRITPSYKPYKRPFGRETTRSLGDLQVGFEPATNTDDHPSAPQKNLVRRFFHQWICISLLLLLWSASFNKVRAMSVDVATRSATNLIIDPGQFIATSAQVTPNGEFSSGILPKMAEKFWLRIYNKLPRLIGKDLFGGNCLAR